MNCDAVFEGGGVKGLAFIGAIQETERRGYQFQRLAGTSAGALVATLIAAGYKGEELEAYANELSFSSFLDHNKLGKIPYLGPSLSLIFYNGLYQGKLLEEWIGKMLANKGIYTFGDLPEGKLRIIASDITNGQIFILPDDLGRYQLDWRRFPVSRAVRMSCSIPYFFQPVVMRQKTKKIYVVDGTILSNYPLWLFDTEKKPKWPTFGFRLRGGQQAKTSNKINGPISMLLAIFSTMREAHDRLYIRRKDAARTIFIPTDEVKATDFELSELQKKRLIALGQEEAKLFFKKWNFLDYLRQYPVKVL